jgi:hypothetical protein
LSCRQGFDVRDSACPCAALLHCLTVPLRLLLLLMLLPCALPVTAHRPEELRLLLQHAMAQVSQDSGLSASERCSYLRWLFYSYLAAAHEAAAAAAGLSDVGAAGAVVRDQQPQLVLDWQSIWLDALSSTLQLAAQLALSPGFGGQALVQLFSFIVPSGFPDAVAAAAVRAAAAALQAGPGAPRAAMADLQVQLHIQRQVQALAFWQRYAQLDGRYEAWMADAEGVAGGDAVYDANTADSLVACGEALVQEMLALAQDDSLLQPATPNIVHALACAAAVTGQQPLAIASGQALATPQHDAAAAGPMAALAAAGGDDDDAAADDDVMGSLQQPAPFNQLSLAVMLSRRQPGVVGEAQVAAHDPSQPFLPLAVSLRGGGGGGGVATATVPCARSMQLSMHGCKVRSCPILACTLPDRRCCLLLVASHVHTTAA